MLEQAGILDSCVEAYEADWFQGRPRPFDQYLPATDSPHYAATLRELVLVDRALRASTGELPELREYLARYPILQSDANALAVLERSFSQSEEMDASGSSFRPAEGSWRDRVEQLYRKFHQADDTHSIALAATWSSLQVAKFEPGVSLAGFRLVRELGHGSFGRVYLAEQKGLAGRHVVLKVGRHLYDESQRLASLQHTNIVPIYSAHTQGGLQILCMPYLGDRTLAHATSQKRHTPREALTIALAVAQGLAHAHQRGIVHRDLKPANVLLATDGTPLILDFNLAADARVQAGRELIGGTLPYMSPEQLRGMICNELVADERSDIYAIGVILCELLTGKLPFPTYQGADSATLQRMEADRAERSPVLRELRRHRSPAEAAIVRRCLEPVPAQRYASAEQLAEDLSRHLSNLPLRHQREPSLIERMQKFRRRNPRGIGLAAAAVLSLALVGAAVAAAWQSHRATRAIALTNWRDFQDELTEARMLVSLPFPAAEDLAEGRALSERALARYDLPSASDWQRSRNYAALTAEEQQAARIDLRGALLVAAREAELRARFLGDDASRGAALEAAARLKMQAEQLEASVQSSDNAQSLADQASELAIAGEFQEAIVALQRAIRLQPGVAAHWAQLGTCQAAVGQTRDAVASFSTCVALKPSFWRAYFWRGQAHLELQQPTEAELDFAEVLQVRPEHVPSLAMRALSRLGQKKYDEAEEDLTQALSLAPEHTRLYFMRSRVRRLRNDAEGAAADLELGLKQQPTDELSWIARGVAQLAKDPQAALADFEAALKLNPWSREAAQNKAHVLGERLGKNEQALATLDPIVERFPDFVIARTGRGVYHARLGHRAESRADAQEALRQDDRPLILYQAACIHALNSREHAADADEALRLLRKALRGGFGGDLLARDADVAPLREHAEFAALIAEYGR